MTVSVGCSCQKCVLCPILHVLSMLLLVSKFFSANFLLLLVMENDHVGIGFSWQNVFFVSFCICCLCCYCQAKLFLQVFWLLFVILHNLLDQDFQLCQTIRLIYLYRIGSTRFETNIDQHF